MKKTCLLVLLFVFLAACEAGGAGTTIPVVTEPVVSPSLTLPIAPPPEKLVIPTSALHPTATLDTRLPPEEWQDWPVVPITISARTLEVYQRGQELGNNPRAFSKIGDGEISTAWFFVSYDLGPSYYDLGAYADLQSVVDYFSGSFGRSSMAARRGFNTLMILDPAFASQQDCNADESPLDCELRMNRPSFAFISLGTNQVWTPEDFETGLQRIIERLLDRGVVPILSTKADNLEGDQRINQIIANLAAEYDLPLWNFWLAVQPLPNHGLQSDLEHLTYNGDAYNFTGNLQTAWSWRNLTALHVLDVVWHGVTGQP